MTRDELRARLIQIAAQPPDAGVEHGDDVLAALRHPLVPAAVLVPVVMGEAPGVLLTKRTPHLKAHAGQVSFPGGRIDPEDRGPEDAALREAWEEIGLERGAVEILGRLDDYATGTGYRITPILSLVPPDLVYQPSADEVESVFELPMTVLLDPDAPRRQRQHVRGEWREYWVWPHPDHYIWGATAAILVHLAERLQRGFTP
ncbi:CoA pyrophosphatase [Rhodopila sp.]|uniref:CoA pyrophosphatase n=1 Tax=Rhodopila sp. TaxID=2480087 RepID=UPI002C513D7B|nr:CoA pyrophosphatase [Rhodopila sp.]HVZ07780.1 CoA pyrophosphatase [Rhodopila sp.]